MHITYKVEDFTIVFSTEVFVPTEVVTIEKCIKSFRSGNGTRETTRNGLIFLAKWFRLVNVKNFAQITEKIDGEIKDVRFNIN